MNLDKAKKRISKHVKKGFKGYPQLSFMYFGKEANCATQLLIQLTMEEGGQVQEERFSTETDARENEVIQSALIKIIERTKVNSVIEVEGISIIPSP